MPILTQKHKKGEERGGELAYKDKNMAHTNLTHIICPHYPLSNTFLLICSAFLHPTWLSHTMVPKTQHLPPQQERQTRNKKEGRKFFSLPKRVKPQICLDLLVRRRKRDTTKWIWQKKGVRHKNKDKIRKFVLERTKSCLKKKGTKSKTSGFCLDTLFFRQRLEQSIFWPPLLLQLYNIWYKLVDKSIPFVK